MATVELCSGSSLGTGFQLHIGLAEIHVPRMWVEESDLSGPNVRSAGCMCIMFISWWHLFHRHVC